MMVLEFIGIICVAIVAIVTVGLVAAGASMALLSLVGFLKGFFKSKSDFRDTEGCGTAIDNAV